MKKSVQLYPEAIFSGIRTTAAQTTYRIQHSNKVSEADCDDDDHDGDDKRTESEWIKMRKREKEKDKMKKNKIEVKKEPKISIID